MTSIRRPDAVWPLTRTCLEEQGMAIPEVRFEGEIAHFVAEDHARPPQPGGVLFVGDSDIRLWNDGGLFAECFDGVGAVNRGFGGARTWETLLYFDELVAPHRPRIVVYCCGDNDIARLRPGGAASAAAGFRLFLECLSRRVPGLSKVLYLGIHPSPSDEPLWGEIARANEALRAICRDSPVPAMFVDYNDLLLDADGRPRPELFRPDGLHFRSELYRRLAQRLRPLLAPD